MYAQFKLKEVATYGEIGNWPSQKLLRAFTQRAEGLFIWVATVSDYLLKFVDPTIQLESHISNSSPTGLAADGKMDKLYLTILQSCNWEDETFVTGYHLFMGIIMAVKTLLSAAAHESLHRPRLTLSVGKALRPLSSLLTGLTDKTQPVRILHQSFGDFITVRAQSSPDNMRFYLWEDEHNQRLALMCLVVLNRDLKSNIPGTRYLKDESESEPDVTTGYLKLELHGIPEIGPISEELLYACKFWIDHLVDVKGSVLGLVDALRSFLSTQVVLWMEVLTSEGQFQKLLKVRTWR